MTASVRSLPELLCGLLVAVLLVAPRGVAGQDAQPLEQHRITGGGGVELAVYEGGRSDGVPILFVHGFLGSHLNWLEQFRSPLADEFRLVALDLRGHGDSGAPREAENYTRSEVWAEDIAAVIRELGLEGPILVGWSYGGYIFSDYLRVFGTGDIGGLVFVAAATKAGTEDAFALMTQEVLGVFGDLLAPDLATSVAGTRAFVPFITAGPMDPSDHEVALGVAMSVPPPIRGAMFSRELDNDDTLASVDVPTLVIHGEQDAILRVEAARHIAAMVPGAELLLYENVGHAPHLEAPERFNRDLAAFTRAVQGLQ